MTMASFLRIPDELPDFETVAVELKLIERDVCFRELAFSASLETFCANERRKNLWLMAHNIGLSPPLIGSLLDDWTTRARACAEAQRVFKALIPHQALIRNLVDKAEGGK